MRLGRIVMLPFVSMSIFASAAIAQSPWYEQVAGNRDLTVQYAHLVGQDTDNAEGRATLQATYEGCATSERLLGRTPVALPPNGIPEIVHTIDLEEYVGHGRTAQIVRHSLYFIDRAKGCALRMVPSAILEIFSAGGSCEVDLIKHRAIGFCEHRDAQKHPTPLPNIDWSRIPPQDRAALRARLADFGAAPRSPGATLPPSSALAGDMPASARQSVAGVNCAVHARRIGEQVWSVCVTDKESDPRPFLDTVPASLNAGRKGLLVAVDNPLVQLHAVQVVPELKVSKMIFEVPSGTIVNGVAR